VRSHGGAHTSNGPVTAVYGRRYNRVPMNKVGQVSRSPRRRLRTAVARDGLRGTARRVWELSRTDPLQSESHVWYALDPTEKRPPRSLDDGLILRRGRHHDLSLLEELATIDPDEGGARLTAGNDWWLVLEGQQPLFSCWIFRGWTPVAAVQGGQLQLPDGTVCVEDSIAAPAARGRGIAPAAWTAVAQTLSAEAQHLVTKVGTENTSSRRAVEKVGFEPIAVMRYQRLGPFSRTSVERLDARCSYLLEALEPPR
jgi:RimJ/RimL family protein N-acetyltransferase